VKTGSIIIAWFAAASAVLSACSANNNKNTSSAGGAGSAGFSGSSGSSAGGAGQSGSGIGGDDLTTVGSAGGGQCIHCSDDGLSVLDCDGKTISQCMGTESCDPVTLTCLDPCAAAVEKKQSVGCEYYATFMDNIFQTVCFAAFVANTWSAPAHIAVEYNGQPLDVGQFAYIPVGQGPGLSYMPLDAATGIPPGEVAILFLAGPSGAQPMFPNINCPKPTAVPIGANIYGTGVGQSFHITSDVPVVAYQINPYAGGGSEVTGASLLLPVSAWDTNYIGASAYAWSPGSVAPSMNIVAAEDNTKVTIVPVKPLVGGGGVPAGVENVPTSFNLNRGQHAQITQNDELTGSVIQSDKPVGLMAGHQCMYVPVNNFACDHGEQMVPPIRALGSEYVGVMHRPRMGEPALWRLVGAVDGTQLTWVPDVGGPPSLEQGEVVEFLSSTPFVVKSQDKDHPFILFSHMVGSQFIAAMAGYGDADTVISVPTDQYQTATVFFADPTYPETNLVLVRKKKEEDGKFYDVDLDCAGVLTGWQPVGDYEWTRTDLMTGNFQGVGNCSTGRHEIKSDGPFGLWVWGWGTPLTGMSGTPSYSAWVSYGYPAGMSVQAINTVVVPPEPK
jgi:hypothetical protein